MKHSLDHLRTYLEQNSDRFFAVFVFFFSGWLCYTGLGVLMGVIPPTPESTPTSREALPWIVVVAFVALICSIGLFFRHKWAFLTFGIVLTSIASVALYSQEWLALFIAGTFGFSWISKGLSDRPKLADDWDPETCKSLEDYERRHPRPQV